MADNDWMTFAEIASLGLRQVGRDVRVSRHALLLNGEQIQLGDHVRIDAFCVISAGASGIVIGDHVHLSAFVAIHGGGGRVTLGDFSGLSSYVTLYTVSDDFRDSGLIGPTVPDRFRSVITGEVCLGRFAQVGAHSVILPGVTLGMGSAVGALSLVNRSVPEVHLVAGIPARFISRREAERLFALERELRQLEAEESQ